MVPSRGEPCMVHDSVVGVLSWSVAASLSVLGFGKKMDNVS